MVNIETTVTILVDMSNKNITEFNCNNPKHPDFIKTKEKRQCTFDDNFVIISSDIRFKSRKFIGERLECGFP